MAVEATDRVIKEPRSALGRWSFTADVPGSEDLGEPTEYVVPFTGLTFCAQEPAKAKKAALHAAVKSHWGHSARKPLASRSHSANGLTGFK